MEEITSETLRQQNFPGSWLEKSTTIHEIYLFQVIDTIWATEVHRIYEASRIKWPCLPVISKFHEILT